MTRPLRERLELSPQSAIQKGPGLRRVKGSRPARVRHGHPGGQDLTRPRPLQLVDPVRTEPPRHDHEQRPAILTSQHAGVAGAVELDPMEHLPTLADPETDTSFIWADVAAPHRAFGVHADPVAGDVRPHPPVRQGPIGCDVEGREPTSERLGERLQTSGR